jgi:hypothetical protein
MKVTEWLIFKISLQLWKALGEHVDVNGVWENIGENLKISARGMILFMLKISMLEKTGSYGPQRPGIGIALLFLFACTVGTLVPVPNFEV